MNNENKFILELCKFKYADKDKLTELMKERLDYPYILGHLLYNRVGDMAYYVLKQNELLHKVNREFRNTLKAIYEYNLSKTTSFIESLRALSPVCSDFGFSYAFLKGAYLVDIYPKGLRTSNDIDILINPENITELTNVLKTAGFRQGNIRNETFTPASRTEIISSRMNRGETVPFVKEVNLPGMKYLEIDVDQLTYAEDLGMQVGPMISPAHFKKYIKPSYKRLMEPAVKAGKIVHMHSDGDIRLLVDDIIDDGVQVMNLQDLVNGIDWIANRFRGKRCVELDIDRQSVTVNGTPADIDDLIRREVASIGTPRGGLAMVFGLYPGTPIENVKALMDAMEKYAGYYR